MFIYKIVNKINGKVYVGKTNNPAKRKETHFSAYRKETNKTLYVAMKKYGPSQFDFIVIEECPDDIWAEREIYWIHYYDSLANGYNMIEGGSQPPHHTGEDHPSAKLNWELVREIKNLLANSDYTKQQISIMYNICKDQIYRINLGQSWAEERETYPIRPSNRLKDDIIEEIIWYLENTSMTHREIGQLFNRCRTAITAINNGQNYFDASRDYPIRKK